MVIDRQTNTLFLSDTLISDYSIFFQGFKKLLLEQGIDPRLITGTKDIWCRDYMPVQISEDTFVQFRYEPSYLDYKKYVDKKTRGRDVFPLKDVTLIDTNINLDGGNVIYCGDCVIMTDRIFKENKNLEPEKLLDDLEKLLQVRVVVIPCAPYDFTGHADGAVRYYKDKTVLINEYKGVREPSEKKRYDEYDLHLRMALRNAGLEWECVPCYTGDNNDDTSAYGYYINYLRMGDVVFLPSFVNEEHDTDALQHFQKLFRKVIQVPSRGIAAQGGVLNCISWTVKQ